MQKGAPVFIKVDEYKEVIDVLELIKVKVEDMKSTLNEINKLSDEEDSEIAMWTHSLNEIERKIQSIDKMMFEPEQQW